MSFVFGLLLAPVGGLAGALMIGAIAAIAEPEALPADFLQTMTLLGVTLGALYAAPTTLVILPAARLLLARRGLSGRMTLAAAGFVSGAATMVVFVLYARKANEAMQPAGVLFLVLVGALSGGLCGALLQALMRLRAGASREPIHG